jgi:hypothetical protein
VDDPALAGLPSLLEAQAAEPEGMTVDAFLNELLNGVAAVSRGEGPPQLGVQIHAVTRALATDANAGPELQALGRVLNKILAGDRDPDLSDLPPGLAGAVQQVLAQLGG